jgi:hypothetical protein
MPLLENHPLFEAPLVKAGLIAVSDDKHRKTERQSVKLVYQTNVPPVYSKRFSGSGSESRSRRATDL